jgi:hypothetical protein
MSSQAAELAHRLARNAEAVCRHYLSNGHREGRYWIVGDVANTPGRSLYVRLYGPPSGKRAAGKWTDYVAVLVMLRHSRLGAFPQTIDASTQHNVITTICCCGSQTQHAISASLGGALGYRRAADAGAERVPTDATGTGVLAKLLERHPVVRIAEREVA